MTVTPDGLRARFDATRGQTRSSATTTGRTHPRRRRDGRRAASGLQHAAHERRDPVGIAV
jgi:hypothetical protein